MYAQDLGYENYTSYRRSPSWQRLKPKKGEQCQRRFCSHRATIPHHLNYLRLEKERRKIDYVVICSCCNDLAHFSDEGEKIEVEKEGHALKKRWVEINSLWWNIKQFRPSMFFHWMEKNYAVN